MVTYNLNIPNPPNNPSNDVSKMQTNTNSIQTLIAVDHVGFNTNGSLPNGVGGQHLQVHFGGKNAQGAQTDPQSVLFTGSGTASTVSQLFFRNQNTTLMCSAIRAWGLFDGATGAAIGSQTNNATVVRNSAGNYSVTLQVGSVSSNEFAIIASCTLRPVGVNPPMSINYAITGVGTFDLFVYDLFANTIQDPTSFSFTVLQL